MFKAILIERDERPYRAGFTDLDIDKLEFLTEEIGLSQAIDRAAVLLEGRIRGRVVVDAGR